MNYRDIPRAGAKISVLGMGCMRLPLLKAADGSVNNNLVDEEATSLLVQKATGCPELITLTLHTLTWGKQ